MRIAVVVHGYPPDEAAGVELVAQEQAQALVRRGHSLAVLARAYGARELHVSEVDGVEVWRVPGPAAPPARFEESWSNSAFDETFDRFLDRSRPDVVHAQHLVMLSCSLLERARERGLPTVLSLHDAFYLCHRLFLLDHRGERCPGPDAGARCVPCLADLGGADVARVRFDFMARRLARVDALVAPSRALAERYVADLPFLADRIDVVDPGIAAAVAPGVRAYGGGRDGDPLRFLFVGTWLAHKGLDLLIGALAESDPARWRLDVRGAGVPGGESFVTSLEDATRDLPVAWRGAFPRERLAEVLAQNDVLVLPSRCDESYSRVVREARAAGLAVIASRGGGPAEALHDGRDGLLVEPGSAAELSGAIRRLLDDPELVRRLAVPDDGWPTLDQAAASLESIYARVTTRANPLAVAAGSGSAVAAGSDVAAPTNRGHDGGSPRVSVVYVTKNGAEFLDGSLAAVRRQRGPFALEEIIAIDSGSSDATLSILARHGAHVESIPPAEFGHGRTRNLGARLARGDIVVFLTQDASPADDDWLARLIAPFADDPLVAGVCSRHAPRPGCHPMEWRRVVEFPLFHDGGLVVSSARGNPEYARAPEVHAWFSNNASAIPRAVLERWPFPEVEFAEDQAWARLVLAAGFRIALANDSVILHSHAYSPWTNLQRNFDHACATRETFGVRDDLGLRDCVRAALRETRRDIEFWASARGRSRARVVLRWSIPAAAYHLGAFGGRWLGARAAGLPVALQQRLSLRERQRSGR